MKCAVCSRCGSKVSGGYPCGVCGDLVSTLKKRDIFEAQPLTRGGFRIIDSAGSSIDWVLSLGCRFSLLSGGVEAIATPLKVLRRTDKKFIVFDAAGYPRGTKYLAVSLLDACYELRLMLKGLSVAEPPKFQLSYSPRKPPPEPPAKLPPKKPQKYAACGHPRVGRAKRCTLCDEKQLPLLMRPGAR
jgi:hypothetical protein